MTVAPPIDIAAISTGLRPSPEGIWSSTRREAVSYPAGGHSGCYQVEDASFWFQHRNDCISAMVARNPPPPGAFLDIGGGNGFVAKRLQDDGREVALIEPGATGAANARHGRGLAHVVCATIEEAQFAPASFAAIGMFDVIEHIEDDASFLRAALRLVPAGGMAYFSVPCHAWLWSRADVEAGHFRRHTFASLRRLLEPSCDIAYMSYIFRPLLLPQFLLRALPYALGLGRRKPLLSTQAEHGTGQGAAPRLAMRLLRGEIDNIRAGRSMHVGSSCIVAARKR